MSIFQIMNGTSESHLMTSMWQVHIMENVPSVAHHTSPGVPQQCQVLPNFSVWYSTICIYQMAPDAARSILTNQSGSKILLKVRYSSFKSRLYSLWHAIETPAYHSNTKYCQTSVSGTVQSVYTRWRQMLHKPS